MIRRRLLTFLSTLSLILCVGTVALWVTSSFIWMRIGWETEGADWERRPWGFKVDLDFRSVYVVVDTNPLPTGPAKWYWQHAVLDSRPHRTRPLSYTGGMWCDGSYCRTVNIPFWMLTVMVSPLMIFSSRTILAEAIRSHRRRRGYCSCCGYDLRATPQRCPECGRVSSEGIGS